MNEVEKNAQRIMNELLAARGCIKRLEAELANRSCELYYTEMIASFKKENSELRDKNSELRVALHDLVEACFKADNNGELASEIDGSLMSAAWEALK